MAEDSAESNFENANPAPITVHCQPPEAKSSLPSGMLPSCSGSNSPLTNPGSSSMFVDATQTQPSVVAVDSTEVNSVTEVKKNELKFSNSAI